ncbi:general secretion pathway protein M [Inhella inkyongensis]|uniref:General secretion pathway protein M n=1 Tax=Inhella inkyongensis TaxID=392593 RepID=A0A840RZ63_9BURK|nr:type II secretion system protein GspM [Inhella inkyongensis]MBB5203275.1 general secretion pathway protein M [Inhella inkyongensis]
MSATFTEQLRDARTQAQQQWQALAPRERLGVLAAGLVLGLALLVGWGLLPALKTLREAPAQRAALDAQLQQMQAWAAEAKALRQLPAVAPAQAQQALQAATELLGPGAKLQVQGERAALSFSEAQGEALGRWLAEVRTSARARPIEAQLTRGAKGYAGRIVLSLGVGT